MLIIIWETIHSALKMWMVGKNLSAMLTKYQFLSADSFSSVLLVRLEEVEAEEAEAEEAEAEDYFQKF